ncbi:MAG: DNA-3-methyladenine glycosylase 2 family protein [Thermoleophilia bacterium]|nr:DNA-3-methyladenine glycosylase 2 family protein [Thermoleophilia bacterium]
MLVRFAQPFSFELTTERFRAFGRDPATLWAGGRLFRVLAGREVAISPADGGVTVTPGEPLLAPIVHRFLGGAFDLDAFAAFAAGDGVLARLVEALRGLRPVLVPEPFEALVTSVTAQQVSLQAASAVRARLVERFGERQRTAWAFPRPERIARARTEELRAVGLSARKAEYVLALALFAPELEGLAVLPAAEVKRRLTRLPGIGEWTADWFLARHLGREDAWPAGDLGLRKAVGAFYFEGRDVSADEVRAFGERFGSHANLAAHYLLVARRVLPA